MGGSGKGMGGSALTQQGPACRADAATRRTVLQGVLCCGRRGLGGGSGRGREGPAGRLPPPAGMGGGKCRRRANVWIVSKELQTFRSKGRARRKFGGIEWWCLESAFCREKVILVEKKIASC